MKVLEVSSNSGSFRFSKFNYLVVMNLKLLVLIFVGIVLLEHFGFGQDSLPSFLKIEAINNTYSVGYASYSEEFDVYGAPYLLSGSDAIPLDIDSKTCSFSDLAPNGKYAFFETLEIGWVYESEVDSFLHDRWEGVLVELETAEIVYRCRDYCGQSWDGHQLWLDGTTIVFDGSGNKNTPNRTFYTYDTDSSEVYWITYNAQGNVRETGQSAERFGCGTNIGVHNTYQSDRILVQSIRYENWLLEDGAGCHEMVQEQYVTEFYPSGIIKSQKRFQCIYEGDIFKSGTWKFYNEEGIVIAKEEYGEHFFRR